MKKFVAMDIPTVNLGRILNEIFQHNLSLYCQVLIIPEQEKCQINETPMTSKIEISISFLRDESYSDTMNRKLGDELECLSRIYEWGIIFEEID